MKAFKTVLKVLAVLAAVGAALYVGITYREKIIDWVKKVLKIDAPAEECCCGEDCCCDSECCCEEAATEEVAAETAEVEDKDFEG